MITIKKLIKKDAKGVRDFCFKIIKEVYGFSYRVDWHDDLDDLLGEEVYSVRNKGLFLVAKDKNEIVGTLGMRTLNSRPKIVGLFQNRGYGDEKNIASIWRTYISKEYRAKGIGSMLYQKAEEYIREKGFEIIYLHISRNNPGALSFWTKMGFLIILEEKNEDKTVHMEKVLNLFHG